jgi:hypothetical protein
VRRGTLALAVVAAAGAAWLSAPGVAQAQPCGLPDVTPTWFDFADGTVTFRDELAKPGVIVATSGTAFPAAMRAGGAQTVYWEMHFENDVGTPTAPASPDVVVPRADALFDRAAASSGCATPVIALNELQGATAKPPLSANATQYRTNVITFVQELVTRGATPYVLLAASPNTTGGALPWWQQLSTLAYLVREVYWSAPQIAAAGVGLGSRQMRLDLRTAVGKLTAMGIPPARVGLMLGFQSGGTVGRVGLQPLSSWLEFVKLATLAAQQVGSELAVGSLWNWGWGTLSATGADPDKPAAACVALWARDPNLCDAPSAADFDTSVDEGQLSSLPAYAQCVIDGRVIPTAQLDQAQRLLGSRSRALTALLTRLAATALVPVGRSQEQQAERAMFPALGRFLAATRVSGVTPGFARGVIVDQIRFAQLTSAQLIAEEQTELPTAVCRNDEVPAIGDVRLVTALPFLRGVASAG